MALKKSGIKSRLALTGLKQMFDDQDRSKSSNRSRIRTKSESSSLDRSRTRTQSETSSKNSLKFSTNEIKRELSDCEIHDPIDTKEESEGVSKCCKYCKLWLFFFIAQYFEENLDKVENKYFNGTFIGQKSIALEVQDIFYLKS